jgi:hypothetical protein
MEFAKTFFSVLLQVKGVFWQLARDVVVCQCGLPYIGTANVQGILKFA